MKHFNTSGMCRPDEHYMLPPEPRLPEARPLIDAGKYFVVHAPRQTGKTTTLAALARNLTAEGRYAALHFSCETAEVAEDDYAAAEQLVLASIRGVAGSPPFPPELRPPDPWPEATPGAALMAGLTAWVEACPRPLVLFFDEIDALRGRSLVAILRQLRDGYLSNRARSPHAVVLCGLRDVRDYRATAGGNPDRLGTASPFNVKVASLRLGDFSFGEVAELYGQHTEATGQRFTPEALQRAFEATRGQPWLVNALGWEITWNMRAEPPEPITDDHMDQAVERLIIARETHLDSLAARLQEPRVKRFVEPLVAGTLPDVDAGYHDDLMYARDLGLISPGKPLRIANPIYQEVILRVLGEPTEEVIDTGGRSFVTSDGLLDVKKLLEEFLAFWRLHGEILATRQLYDEAACQLVFMGFLHRVVNGGGYIDREYGVGRGRIDLLVRWPHTRADGSRAQQWEGMELKVRRPGQADPVEEGLAQLDAYLDRLGLDHGTLLVFDRTPQAPPLPERTAIGAARTLGGRDVTLVRA
ncbi:MAG TPA: AAA family ATPase [Streptosporangiaceae bacterium]